MTISLADALASTNVLTPDASGDFVQIASGGAAETEWMNLILAFLSTPQFSAFPVSQWADGSPFKALAQTEAFCLSDLSGTVYNAISGGILDLATGDWLDLWGQGLYNETREPAVQEVSYLWCSTGASPVNLDAGELVVQTPLGVQFANTDPIALAASTANQRITVRATNTSPGSAGAVQEGDIQFVVSPGGTGMSVSNLDPSTPGTGSWEVTRGEDAELDAAYKTRLQARWPSLSLLRGSTEAAWGFWITQQDPGVRQWQVLENTPTGGQVTVYVDPLNADPAGGYIVNNWINGLNGQVKHRPLCTTVTVLGASTLTITVTGTVYTPSEAASAATALSAALAKYAAVVPMGGVVYYSIVTGLVQQIALSGHWESIALSGVTADVSLATGTVPAFDISGVQFLSV